MHDMIVKATQMVEEAKTEKAKTLGNAEKDKKWQTLMTHYSVSWAAAAMKLEQNVDLV